MPYTPPIGVVALHLTGRYTPPVGVVNLHVGADPTTDRLLSAQATTAAPTGSASVLRGAIGSVSASTAPPTVRGLCGVVRRAMVNARTAGATAVCRPHFDPNLLSGTIGLTSSAWGHGDPRKASAAAVMRQAPLAVSAGRSSWAPAAPARALTEGGWRSAERACNTVHVAIKPAPPMASGTVVEWRQAERLTALGIGAWGHGDPLLSEAPVGWRNPPRLGTVLGSQWARGQILGAGLQFGFADGAVLSVTFATVWHRAGYPGHWLRIPPVTPPIINPTGRLRLCIGYPLDGANLHLGRRCRSPFDQRFYMVLNSASLVRLPDRVPLPATEITIAADCDSWCWSLSGTLFGGADLVTPTAPAFLPVEVEATVNGYTWQFLLDDPGRSQQFASDTLRISGRSRSAWLGAPYTASSQGTNPAPTSAAQAADAAVENTGWSVDFSAIPDWLIPAGVLRWDGTPIERLVQLVKPVDGCLLTARSDALIRAYLRYPRPGWEWTPAKASPDAVLARAAIRELSREADRRALVNGVYISGTVTGVLASCVTEGTAGDQQAEMVADVLLCDAEGVAARSRAVSVLGQSGPGWRITAQTLLQPLGTATVDTAPGLIEPGWLVNLAGDFARCRGVSIQAGSDGEGRLSVSQTLTLEQREQEA